MPEPQHLRATSTRTMSLLMIVIGCAMVIRTIVAGGSAAALGIILGVLFIAAGAGRLYLQLRR
jgi:hypothetical protein